MEHNSVTPIIRTVKVTDIVVGDRYRQALGDIPALAKSIQKIGLLQLPVVTSDLRLVAGRRRLEAVRELKWEWIEVRIFETFDDALLALRAEQDENTCRKDFTPSEAVRIGKALEEMVRAQAKKRQGRAGKKRSSKLDEHASTGPTDKKVAEAVGMKKDSYRKAKKVVEAAEQQPEQFAEVVAEMDRTGRVDPAFKKVREKKTAKKVPANQPSKKALSAPPAAPPAATPATMSPDGNITRKQAAKVKHFLGELSPKEWTYTVREMFTRQTCLNLSNGGLDSVIVCLRKKASELIQQVCSVLESLAGPDAADVLMVISAVLALNPASREELLTELRCDQAQRERQSNRDGRPDPDP